MAAVGLLASGRAAELRSRVRAAWYEKQGPAAEVLQVGDVPAPEPGPGDVRVRVRFSGVNPGDTKKRRGWLGSQMPYPRVIPHSDGAGTVDAVGPGVDPSRIGRCVWLYGAQSYRPFGTAAEFTVVRSELAVDLPDEVSDEIGACLGIPGVTAHRAVFADGHVSGQTVLVHGVLGGVGALAAARTVGRCRRRGTCDAAPISMGWTRRSFPRRSPSTIPTEQECSIRRSATRHGVCSPANASLGAMSALIAA
jgi:D-arabinose 1-dehydrogenase-like Zn-dependent alcohol dehydrogenase